MIPLGELGAYEIRKASDVILHVSAAILSLMSVSGQRQRQRLADCSSFGMDLAGRMQNLG